MLADKGIHFEKEHECIEYSEETYRKLAHVIPKIKECVLSMIFECIANTTDVLRTFSDRDTHMYRESRQFCARNTSGLRCVITLVVLSHTTAAFSIFIFFVLVV